MQPIRRPGPTAGLDVNSPPRGSSPSTRHSRPSASPCRRRAAQQVPSRSASSQGSWPAMLAGPNPQLDTISRGCAPDAAWSGGRTRRRSRITSRTVTPVPHKSTASRSDRPSSSVMSVAHAQRAVQRPGQEHRGHRAPSTSRAGVYARPASCAARLGHQSRTAVPPASATADSSTASSSTPILNAALSPRDTANGPHRLRRLLHVPLSHFKISCATHPMHRRK